MNFYVPENLDLGFIRPIFRPAAQWMVHSIYMMRTMRKMDRSDFANLRYKILQQFMGDSARTIVAQLLESNVLECDGVYEVGKKSYGYRLCEPWRSATHRLIPVTTPVMLKRLAAGEAHKRATWSAVHHWLLAWIEQMELPASLKKWPDDALAIARIQNKDFWFSVCRYGRVHTPATNIRRELRGCLKINGQALAEIDIANSQPLMLSMLAQERGVTTKDAQTYRSLCEKGRLYDHLMEKQGVPASERNEFKRKVIGRVLYCKARDQDGPLSLAFGKEFPSMMQVIKDTKKQGHKHLPRHMQRMESNIIIRDVCGRLMRDYPEVPIITVHDSIMTPVAHVGLVKRIMKEEFAQAGVAPTLKVKEPCRCM